MRKLFTPANVVLALVATALLALAIRHLLMHGFDSGTHGLIFFLILVSLSAAAGAGLMAPRQLKVVGAMVVVWIGVAMFAGEVILASLYIFRPQADSGTVEEFDTRSKKQVLRDLRESGENAVPSFLWGHLSGPKKIPREGVAPTEDGDLFYFGGIARRVTVQCNEVGVWETYKSDEWGFNNPRGIWDSGPLDVALIGDSYTHGDCVPEAKNIAGVLRQNFPATLNLGVGSTGPLIQLAILREHLPEQRPRNVIWIYFEGNDHTGLLKERKIPAAMAYLEPGYRQGIRAVQAELDRVRLDYVTRQLAIEDDAPWFFRFAKRRILNVLLLVRLRRFLGILPPEPIDRLLFERVLLEAKKTVLSWGGRLHFVYLPDNGRYGVWSGLAGNNEQIRKAIVGIATKVGLPVVDMHKIFAATGKPLAFFNLHNSVAGQALIADKIAQAIREQ